MAEQEINIAIQKIYLKDFSFESPNAPGVFAKSDWEPKTNLNLRSTHTPLNENNHEVVLTLTVETKHEEKTLFLVELHQAGIFGITGYEGDQLAAILGSFCPNVLFPYCRESIASIVGKGGFPEFILQPINFDALFAQSQQAIADKKAEEEQTGEKQTPAAGNGGAH